MTEAYPLKWPDNKTRTRSRENARFKVSFAKARDDLFDELERLGARSVVLSTNVELRGDGKPYANQKNPEDPGSAIYFQYKGKSMCFACDRWRKVEDNIQAVHHTIEALRGIARWGTGDMLQAAFDGFQALPPPCAESKREWWNVLGVDRDASISAIEVSYRIRAKDCHPDKDGGSHDQMAELNAAIAIARKEKSL